MSSTPAVGPKFDMAGSPLPFAGCSMICEVPVGSPLYVAGGAVQDRCRAAGLGRSFIFLPPASFHMTLFDLVCYGEREPARWSSLLPLDAPQAEVDRFMADRMRPIRLASTLRLKVTGVGELGGRNTLRIMLGPADGETEADLAAYREAASLATGVRLPSHDSYAFHFTLAYPLALLDEEESRGGEALARVIVQQLEDQGEVQVGAPYLSFFEDMFSFPRERSSTA